MDEDEDEDAAAVVVVVAMTVTGTEKEMRHCLHSNKCSTLQSVFISAKTGRKER